MQCGQGTEDGRTLGGCDPRVTPHDFQADDIAGGTAISPGQAGISTSPGEIPDPPIWIRAVSGRVAYAVITMNDGHRFNPHTHRGRPGQVHRLHRRRR